MRAALYARVSTEDQVEGHSLKFQKDDCHSQAAKDSFTVEAEHVYVDEGYSAKGSALDRPAFQRMIEDAKKKPRPFDRIYVWKWDRFTRSREDAVIYKGLLRRDLGVEIVSVKEPFDDPESPAGYLLEGVTELIAGWYSKDLRQKVSRSRQRRVELGLTNGDAPFGYGRHPETSKELPLPWIVVPAEAEVVRQAFEMYASSRHTLQQVATWLNQSGHRPKAKRRDRAEREYLWSKDTVKDMLGNQLYLGLTKYKGATRPGRHEAIISEELFRCVQQVKKEHYRGPSTFAQRHRTYLLAGLARCALCGEKLWAHHIRGSDYYREESSLRGIPCPNPKRYVRADVIEGQLSEVMSGLKLPTTWRDLVTKLLDSSDEREAARKERLRLEEKLRRLSRQYREVEIDEAEYKREREITQAQLAALEEVAQPEAIRTGDYIEGLVEAWRTATKEEKRDLLRMCLEAVYVDMESASLVALKPKPAFLPLFNLEEPVKAGTKLLVTGDPEGIRTPDLHRDRVACLTATPRGRVFPGGCVASAILGFRT